MPASYLDENGLEHVVVKAKETFANKKELWNWQKTEKAGAVAFEPVPDSVLEPVVEFKFKETLPAEGEKGPDNPSTIEGVSSATIWRTGKNLRFGGRTEGTYTQNGLTYTYNSDGSITFNGTATEGTFFYLNGGETRIQTKANFTYILSGCPSGGSQDTYSLSCTSPFNGSTVYAIDRGNGFIINKSQDMSWDMYIYINSGITVSNLTFKPQIEIGSIATDYEPPILLSEAIHVFSLGNTYYGGSVNLATGVMTVTHLGFAFDGTEEWRTIGNVGAESDTFRHDLINTSFPELRRNVGWPTCSHFSTETNTGSLRAYLSGIFQETTWFFVVVDTNAVYSTNEAWKAFLATQYANGTPVTIAYQLETPFEVQLDPIQIKSVASLDKYEPRINTIYTDAESIQVGYQKFTAEGNFVHTTGNETIDGIKTIANTRPAARDGETVTSIYFRNPEVTRGVPHPTGRSWTQMLFLDANGEPETNQAGRLGMFELVSPSSVTPNMQESMSFTCYKFTDNPNEYNVNSTLRVGFDGSRIPYATAPSTSSERTENTDIVTRDWLPKDNRIPQKSDLWNWQKTEKAEIVTFTPVPDSVLEPVVEFKFKEILPAKNEKGLDNPSTIEGVSSVTIVRGSSNLASIPRNKTQTFVDGTVFSSDADGRITITGTPTANRHTQGTSLTAEFIPNLPAGRYLLSAGVNTHNSAILVHIIKANGGNTYPAATTNLRNKDFYLEEGDIIHDIRVQTYSDTTYNETVFPCLSLYGANEDISANESYTVDFPSTYYGGEIDFATGVMTVTHYGVVLDSTTFSNCGYAYNTDSNGNRYLRRVDMKLDGSNNYFPQCVVAGYTAAESSMTHFNFDRDVTNDCTYRIQEPTTQWFIIKDDSGVLFSDSRTAAENKQYFLDWCDAQKLAGTPVTLTYRLENSFTVQLSPIQIKSISAIDKYSPRINTIYTNAESVQVGYQRYTDEGKLLKIGIDENNEQYTTAPQTSNDRNDPGDVLTRSWRISESEIDELSN